MRANVDSAARRIDFAQAAGLAAFGIAIVVLWNTWALYPLRLLVVFFHELSHGIAAVVTGGSIVEIRMTAQEGGLCITRGGVPFVTLSAGYLGSLVWGGGLLIVATRTKGSQIAIELLGALLLVVTLVWVRPMTGFGFAFGLGAGLALIAAAYAFKSIFNELALTAIGLTSVLYAVLDIKSDILDRPQAVSDAVLLAQATGVPALVWGVLWFGVSLMLAVRFVIVASRRTTPAHTATTSV
ncbi:MAG: M50 family metallopeptidase [Candidatus Hydrogenedentes bacterium]|nr:M50 family metallopeptidase [Candidatus Hydrogenedentota bacterium]